MAIGMEEITGDIARATPFITVTTTRPMDCMAEAIAVTEGMVAMRAGARMADTEVGREDINILS